MGGMKSDGLKGNGLVYRHVVPRVLCEDKSVWLERLGMIWESNMVWGTDVEDSGPGLQPLCSEDREEQTKLVYCLWDPG